MQVVLLLRGFCKGETTRELAAEVGLSYQTVFDLRHAKPATINRRLAALSMFCRWALRHDLLHDDDFKLLRDQQLAGSRDEGRLFARVTDLGLSEVTGIERGRGIPECASRLAEEGFVRILNLHDHFRDTHGQFSGR